jgi:hypothetical protein
VIGRSRTCLPVAIANTYPGGYWENRRYKWFSGI